MENLSEQLVTEDFVVIDTTFCARSSLIELILPFAEESKSIPNVNGVLPWQLSVDPKVAIMLKPSAADLTSEETLPVTAS